MAKRKGLLFSLLYFMAEFWLTSQQVLRIGKWQNCHIVFFMSFLLTINVQTATMTWFPLGINILLSFFYKIIHFKSFCGITIMYIFNLSQCLQNVYHCFFP